MTTKQTARAATGGQTLVQTAYEELLSRILDGRLLAGTPVSEGRLAEDIGLSRTPLREAIGRLEGEGLMQRSGRSVTVCNMSLRDFAEALHMRRLLECEAAGRAALSVPPETIAKIRKKVAAMDRSVSSAKHWAVDDLIHNTIAEATGSRLLTKTVADLRRRTRMFGRDRIPSRFEDGQAEHLKLLDAIASGDAGAATDAMAEHLDNTKKAILAELERFG